MPQSYKIPQNVDLEDKILGPFTLKQFFFLLGAGVLTFIHFSVWYTISPAIFYLLTFFTWVIAVAFVFVRPNDQPFSKYALSFIWFALKPQRRIWQRVPTLGDVQLKDKAPKVAPRSNEPSAKEVRSKLSRLAHVVDTRGWSDVSESADIAGRVAAGEATPQYNLDISDSDQPEDILAREDEQAGSDRTSAELDRVLKRGTTKPRVSHDVRVKQAARHAEG